MAKADTVKAILDGRREFTLETLEGETEHYFIANPTGEDIRKADWEYSKIYNKAIVDGFLTQAQMLKLLKEKSIISEEYTERLDSVRTTLAAELFRLEHLDENISDIEKESIALEVASLRDELFQLNQMVNGPMGNTCENLAEDSRTEFLTSRIIQKKDGSKVWPDFNSYQSEENTNLSVKSRFEVMLWMQGLGSDFLENAPEQAALREIAQARLNKALEDITGEQEEDNTPEAKTEEVQTEDIDLNSKIQEKTKAKKRGRPKGSNNKKAAAKKRVGPKKKTSPKKNAEDSDKTK